MIRTGIVESWTASPETLGPIYPFLGWEVPMILVVVALWIGWTIWQVRAESAEYARIAEAVRTSSDFSAALAEAEPDPPEPRHPPERDG